MVAETSFFILSLALLITAPLACGDGSGANSTFTLLGSASQTATDDTNGDTLLSVSPSSVYMKIYAAWISENDTCIDPIQVFNDSDGETFDMTQNPTIGSASVGDGTYKCIIIQFSDIIRYTPATSEGSCTAGVEVSQDICRADSGSQSIDPSGTTISCTGTFDSPSENIVTLYISTLSTTISGVSEVVDHESFFPPTVSDPTRGFNLDSPLEITSATSGTFYADFTNKVVGSRPECDLNPPIFGFR